MSWKTLREHRTFHQTDAAAHSTSEEKGYSEVGVLFLYGLHTGCRSFFQGTLP